MIDVHLFAEDQGHEVIVGELVRKVAAGAGVQVDTSPENVRGGYGRAVAALRQYVRKVGLGIRPLPDILVVATDANCKGHADRVRAIREASGHLVDRLVCAIPDPHVERWLLVDSHSFKLVLGRGCAAPDQKCDRDRYKELLARAVEGTGRRVEVGGLEHAAALVQAIDLRHAQQLDPSLGRFVEELESAFRSRSP
jgi:hypothetical protein